MNKWDLFKGIEGIDDDILERSEGMTDSALSEKIAIKKDNTEKEGKTLKEDKTQKLKKYIILRKWTTAAACICLLVGGIAFGLSAVKGSVPGDDFWDSVQGRKAQTAQQNCQEETYWLKIPRQRKYPPGRRIRKARKERRKQGI